MPVYSIPCRVCSSALQVFYHWAWSWGRVSLNGKLNGDFEVVGALVREELRNGQRMLAYSMPCKVKPVCFGGLLPLNMNSDWHPEVVKCLWWAPWWAHRVLNPSAWHWSCASSCSFSDGEVRSQPPTVSLRVSDKSISNIFIISLVKSSQVKIQNMSYCYWWSLYWPMCRSLFLNCLECASLFNHIGE